MYERVSGWVLIDPDGDYYLDTGEDGTTAELIENRVIELVRGLAFETLMRLPDGEYKRSRRKIGITVETVDDWE